MAAQSRAKSAVAIKRHGTNGNGLGFGVISRYFRRSEPFDTDRLGYLGALSATQGGVAAEDGNVTRRAVPALCRGKRCAAAKAQYPLEILTAFEGQRVSPH